VPFLAPSSNGGIAIRSVKVSSKKVVDSFAPLGLDGPGTHKASLGVYRGHFQNSFIDATENYYKQGSESPIAQRSVSDYLEKVEGRLREEGDCVERCLNTQTRLALVQWKSNFFLHIRSRYQKLAGAALRLIENGDTIGLVKKVVDSPFYLSLDESEAHKASLDVYGELFENPFIDATKCGGTASSRDVRWVLQVFPMSQSNLNRNYTATGLSVRLGHLLITDFFPSRNP